MRLLVLITTYKKTVGRVKTIENTWAKTLREKNIPYYFVTGDKIEVKAPFLFLKNFIESYEQLPLKTYNLLKESLNFEYDYLIKTDDDTFLNANLLTNDILSFDYVGKFNKPSLAPTLHYFKCTEQYKVPKKPAKFEYAEGGMYILSRKAVNKILETPKDEFINTPENYKGEDVFVGDLLHDKTYTKLNINDVNLSKKLNMDITNKGLSIHPVHNILMPKLFNKDLNEQIKILLENPILNDYNKRDLYLKCYDR